MNLCLISGVPSCGLICPDFEYSRKPFFVHCKQKIPWSDSGEKETLYWNQVTGDLPMLKQLHIQNYAIIEDISIDFSGKLNIITGETGAGKSILTGATALVLGSRADTSVLLNREKKCLWDAASPRQKKK